MKPDKQRDGKPQAEGEFIYGRHAVEAALDAGQSLNKLWVAESTRVERRVLDMAHAARVPVQFVDRRRLDALVPGAPHQGIVAALSAYRYADLDAILADKQTPFLLLLDGVEDPHNLGALIRTAEAAGVDAVAIPERRAVGMTAAVAKASAGAAARVPVARVANLSRVMEDLKGRGLWIAGVDVAGDQPLAQADLRRPLALVIGGEGKGLGDLVKKRCDYLIRIPMRGAIASLNASVAGALAMYEVLRREAPPASK